MPTINYCSLEEVWGNNDIKEDMDNYNKNKESIHKTQLQAYDENQELYNNSDYEELMQIYSKDELENKKKNNSKNDNSDKTIKESLTSIIENFSTLSNDENNNDLILLVILGIFIIFVMDSLVKLKTSF